MENNNLIAKISDVTPNPKVWVAPELIEKSIKKTESGSPTQNLTEGGPGNGGRTNGFGVWYHS
jgi:hypothetical protein